MPTPSPIDVAIQWVERWIDAIDRERDRAVGVLKRLREFRGEVGQEPCLLFPERPRRVLPDLVFQQLKMAGGLERTHQKKRRA